MKVTAFVLVLSGCLTCAAAGQATRQPRRTPAAISNPVADAYEQFLLARYLEREDDVEGAVAAYKRAMALDPASADVPASLAALYMNQSRTDEATAAAEQALKIAPANVEAHRVLGTIYASLASNENRAAAASDGKPDQNAAKAISHFEYVLAGQEGEADANLRANLARLYVRNEEFDKAIPLLRDLIGRDGWRDGSNLLVEAYAGAGKNAEAIGWLEEAAADDPRLYAALAEFYERDRRWKDAATAYATAAQVSPRNFDLKTRYASALLNEGRRDGVKKAEQVLTEALSGRPGDQRALYLLSQAERRLGDIGAAEATARRVIAMNGKSPWGYYALAEALEYRQQYQAVIDSLVPAVADFRTRRGPLDVVGLGLLLPHLGFAYQQLGSFDQAIVLLDEAHRLSPTDSAVTSYLIEANLSAKKYATAIELASLARKEHPDDLRLARQHAQALRQNGEPDQAVRVLEDLLKKQSDQPMTYIALASLYADTSRGPQAITLLEGAQAKFPADTSIDFELGAVFDKQKRFADAEAAFRRVLAREPDHAGALNYLGYMLADRGERLDESVAFLKKALEIEPDNGSFLDSLGWAYYKTNRLDLASENLKRAAEQLKTNSVIQDHYGDVLFKLARYTEAIDAWTRALAGDSDSIDRPAIDKKIRSAQQKLKK